MAHPQLTPGAIAKVQSGELGGESPAVQIIDLKHIANPSGGRYRLLISDGLHMMQAMLATQLNHIVERNEVRARPLVGRAAVPTRGPRAAAAHLGHPVHVSAAGRHRSPCRLPPLFTLDSCLICGAELVPSARAQIKIHSIIRLDNAICNLVQSRKVAILLNITTLGHAEYKIG